MLYKFHFIRLLYSVTKKHCYEEKRGLAPLRTQLHLTQTLMKISFNSLAAGRVFKVHWLVFMYACLRVCVPLKTNLSPSGCWNMNARCKCSAIPLAVPLQSPAYRNELWQGNSGRMGLHEKPFLLPLIVCHSKPIGSRALTALSMETQSDSVNPKEIGKYWNLLIITMLYNYKNKIIER